MAADDPSRCKAVDGELYRTPAPPSYVYRLRTNDGETYPLDDDESGQPELLEALRVAFARGDGPVQGIFTICLTGTNALPAYDGTPVQRARLTAVALRSSK
jgi:hypothetical protein